MAEFSQSKTSKNLNEEIQGTVQDHFIALIKTARLSNYFKFSNLVTWQKKYPKKPKTKQEAIKSNKKSTKLSLSALRIFILQNQRGSGQTVNAAHMALTGETV